MSSPVPGTHQEMGTGQALKVALQSQGSPGAPSLESTAVLPVEPLTWVPLPWGAELWAGLVGQEAVPARFPAAQQVGCV